LCAFGWNEKKKLTSRVHVVESLKKNFNTCTRWIGFYIFICEISLGMLLERLHTRTCIHT